MALNLIWTGFFLVAFIVALYRVVVLHHMDVFSDIVQSTFDMAEVSVDIALYLIGVMTLWMGIMKIGEEGGAINLLGRLIAPFFRKIFPSLPKDHPAHGSMLMNISANMLGLDNAATPMGLKAMEQLQDANPDKTRASNPMIMFLVLNTSGLTLIPVSVMALRASSEAAMPSDVFLPILLATFFSTLVGLLAVMLIQRINIFQPIILGYLGGLSALVFGLLYFLRDMPPETVSTWSGLIGNFIIFGLIIAFISLALYRKINLYNTFIDGAKEGFNTTIKILPYLVAMLVGIGVFRASGALDLLQDGVSWIVGLFTDRSEFVDALPVAYLKPLSGSGARAAMIEVWQNPALIPEGAKTAVDTFAGRLASTFQGSTETTFYTLAVYYGVVRIKNTRYTVQAGLLADLAGIVSAILIAYFFFPV